MKLSFWRVAALLALPLFSTLSTPSLAADTQPADVGHGTDHGADCSQSATQADMEQCAAKALNQADAELNQTYVDYRNRLDQERQNQIRDVQLAWIKYRDLSCKYATSGTGGSAHGMALQLCLSEKTLARTKELKALASCQEGDLSCPR